MQEPDEKRAVLKVCQDHGSRPENLLEVLHAVQAHDGYLSDDSLREIATCLNLTRAEVHGVASFYHDFRRVPPGKTVVKICLAEACQAVGCDALKEHAAQALSTDMGTTSSDGEVSLEPVYCLGNCALGPAVMINGVLHGRVTPEKLDSLVSRASS
ncbi:MAG: NADH-quinone oxidoreductase subunit E [Rhodospirillaceae bacterium]|nr:NADH-quinone oxidoreductase subunit E [Rhodospirillaceae bacterium]MBT5241076.1 NADH-quinone oxidoreductase subunit E [Rhodospirillaceae bacterium]MBT5566732.1 NADH-quinone oxidoreductase subunit E [Rhodospirillaceae bacterium]MBT6090794.1 NADH-quinone oxidoreductase subunit E [Rhodospirillaceae bacterium]MBT7449504.1 NADH-quinone oxidoreductase subunit E [Rhodospirillaceae bacterium]